MTKLTVTQTVIEAERIEPEDDRPAVGSWWWVKGSNDDAEYEYQEYDSKKYDRGKQWLGCVIEVGSNYAKLKGVKYVLRIALDDMPKRCLAEHEPQMFIDAKVNEHRTKVRELMGEIKRVCAQIGVPYHQALAEAEAPSTALAVAHDVEDVNKYQKALVKAKDDTLPELFDKVKAQHKHMSTWMGAELIPAHAELERARGVTQLIKNKIHTVELYAGLQEQLVCIKKGEPAPVDTKVHLMQRRAYMDEECLARYEAGGMDFENLKAFNKWIARDENMTRILPHERCIVAMRIRRNSKDYGIGDSLSRFIRLAFHNEHNKATFLYIRNGRQLWCMRTTIEFSSELFPRREDEDLIGDDELWCKPNSVDDGKFISGRAYAEKIAHWKEDRTRLARSLWAWKRAGKPEGSWINPTSTRHGWIKSPTDKHKNEYVLGGEDGRPDDRPDDEWRQYERVTPEHIYFDDAMRHIQEVTTEHNRIAVVVQGLLDRSTCLHPHPPWRIWTPEGFATGIELVYDVSLAITPGAEPDWHGYRAQLNKSLRVGAFCIGQEVVWDEEMEAKYEKKWETRRKHGDGPKRIDRIVAIRGGKALFRWTRQSHRGTWVPSKRPGWKELTYNTITESWWCPLEHLTCIDAYTPGDYRMFFDDPRTRAKYLQWAPILLSAEDWHAERRKAKDEAEPKEKKPVRSVADMVDALEDDEDEDLDDDDEDEDLDEDEDEDDIGEIEPLEDEESSK